MDTIELTFSIPLSEHERIIAWLEEAATGFVQDDAGLRAYVPADRWATVPVEKLEARLAADGFPDALAARPLAAKNWNEVWEDSLSPIRVGRFVIAPTSIDLSAEHDPATVLRIDPEMSFGTGHHATTRLALSLLEESIVRGDRVLDVGTGTGILAIAACRLGAASSTGVDTNPDAVRNARENVRENRVSTCAMIRKGSTDVASDDAFDVVVANMTRRLLLDLLPDLVARLAPDGTLILSGILEADRASVREAARDIDLRIDADTSEEGWWAARFSRRSRP